MSNQSVIYSNEAKLFDIQATTAIIFYACFDKIDSNCLPMSLFPQYYAFLNVRNK